MTKIIEETLNYTLQVGASVESGNPCYQIVNKAWNVIEIETYLLPQALTYIQDLEAGLLSIKNKPVITIVPKGNNPKNSSIN